MKTEKLKPCSCGSKNLVFVRRTNVATGHKGELGVRCKDCLTTHFEGGRHTKAEAIELWNQRAPATAHDHKGPMTLDSLLEATFGSPLFIVLAPMFFLALAVYEGIGVFSPAYKH